MFQMFLNVVFLLLHLHLFILLVGFHPPPFHFIFYHYIFKKQSTMSAEEVAKAFLQYFYSTFDSNVEGLASLYVSVFCSKLPSPVNSSRSLSMKLCDSADLSLLSRFLIPYLYRYLFFNLSQAFFSTCNVAFHPITISHS